MVQIGQTSSSIGRDAVRQHLNNTIEIRSVEIHIGERTADKHLEVGFGPCVRRGGGHQLLGKNVQRR